MTTENCTSMHEMHRSMQPMSVSSRSSHISLKQLHTVQV